MYIEQKQNKIFRPQSNTTLSAEETNQVTTEFNNQIIAGGLTPSASSLTQLRDSIQNVVNTSANNLQEQIDAITAASDVFDVVGTYAQLEAYDKSTVPLNDIIKVLQDSTHNNAATYYRLVETSGATEWQYLGQEGPYYTKSEIDTNFALKSQLPDIATTQQVGLVKPDGTTTFVGQDGALSVSSNIAAALPLFTYIWADHIMNDASYSRANTFSWQSGSVYTNAYNHLVNDIAGVTASTETISGTTITFYQATDGHKIVLADQETNVQTIFTATGVAWYYILDTANVRFKLPRSLHGDIVEKYHNGTDWYRVWSDGWCEQGGYIAPNSTSTQITFLKPYINTDYSITGGLLNGQTNTSYEHMNFNSFTTTGFTFTTFDSYGVKWETKGYISSYPTNDQYKYLYFYIGNFSQSATEQTAGLNTELFNDKVDLDGSNATFPHIVETYHSGTEWYRVWSDGWCEQGGRANRGTSNIINLYIDMGNTDYTPHVTCINAHRYPYITGLSTNSFSFNAADDASDNNDGLFSWSVRGYITEE